MHEIVWGGTATLSLLVFICFVFSILVCIWGCSGKERKDELVGIEGHVKIRNPDVSDLEVNGNTVEDRATSTVQRSLPDLPVDNPVSWDPNDTASELYATVGGKNAIPANPGEGSKSKPSTSHAYDKLRNVEHAYAQVRVDGGAEANGGSSTSGSSAAPPSAPVEIAAAPAVAGHVHASEDLPYMTPPTHFSGDSQDSAKGYTSISVREPLAQLRAETTERIQDRHYATVSDDSDDMYAAIDEPASGSETYAKIRPEATLQPVLNHARQESSSSAGSVGVMGSPKPEKREANSPLPAPPADGLPRNLDDMYAKVNKKKRRELDERANSTESGSSECVSYRLQSNISTTDCSTSFPSHTTTTDTTHSCPSQNTTESPSSQRADASDSSLSSDGDVLGPCYEIVPSNCYTSADMADDKQLYETLPKVIKTDANNYETLGKSSFYATLNKGPPSDSDPNYETLDKGPPSDSDPNYERIGQKKDTDGYATVFHPSQGQYEVVGFALNHSDPPYATLGSEPPYSSLTPHLEDNGVSEPPYSTLGPRHVEPPYSTINKVTEPPYQLLSNFESGSVVKDLDE